MRCFLVHSPGATAYADLLPANPKRQSAIDALICGYNLHRRCKVVPVFSASERMFWAFHDKNYVQHLLGPGPSSQDAQFGLTYDCPVFDGLIGYSKAIAGASDSVARCLQEAEDFGDESECVSSDSVSSDSVSSDTSSGSVSLDLDKKKVVLNWYGGRHHAGKAHASGFCYVNDIVLTILRCRVSHPRVVYLDFDLHHGDAVENAFRFSKSVCTFSVHRYDKGFFPGTGKTSVAGAYNIPARRGLSDHTLMQLVDQVIKPLICQAAPDLVVIQCGCDGLASDPCGEWNLSIRGLAHAIENVVASFNADFVLLGGGGYHTEDAAKFYAFLTKRIVGDEAEWDELPESAADMFVDYQFWTEKNKNGKPFRKDENDIEEMKRGMHLAVPESAPSNAREAGPRKLV